MSTKQTAQPVHELKDDTPSVPVAIKFKPRVGVPDLNPALYEALLKVRTLIRLSGKG